MTNSPKNIGIVGAGAIAHGLAALLEQNNHIPTIWSPSGRKLEKTISVNGAINTELTLNIASDAENLAKNNDTIIFALPVYGHKSTMDKIAPHIHDNHKVIVSAQASYSAAYLEKKLIERQIEIPVSAWNTTAITAKMPKDSEVTVNAIRPKIDIHTTSAKFSSDALTNCQELFTNTFVLKRSLHEITLNNLNPEIHMGMALCNLTRMENGEHWCQRKHVTPSVGRLIEQLDNERLDIVKAFGYSPKSIFDHYGVGAEQSLSSINQILHAQKPVYGPKTSNSRYVLEDVPYGLAVISKLGDHIGKPTPLHSSGINLFSALYGKNFLQENDLLEALCLDKLLRNT